jgi:hypothetical protein
MAMDPVNKKAVKKDFENRKDQDIDNDGDTDSSDEYLHKRRKAVSKAIKNVKESVELDEGAKEKALKKLMTRALDGKKAKPGYTSAVATNGDFVVHDGGGRIVGRLKKGEYDDPLKESVELDEAPGAKDVADDHGLDRGTRVSKKAWDRLKKSKKNND